MIPDRFAPVLAELSPPRDLSQTPLYQVVFSFFYSNPIDIMIDDVYFYKEIIEE